MCFMFLSRIFHLYPVDNEVDVGESQSSKRKIHLTVPKQNMFLFLKCVPSEARVHRGGRLNVNKESALIPTRGMAPRFVCISTDFRALD